MRLYLKLGLLVSIAVGIQACLLGNGDVAWEVRLMARCWISNPSSRPESIDLRLVERSLKRIVSRLPDELQERIQNEITAPGRAALIVADLDEDSPAGDGAG